MGRLMLWTVPRAKSTIILKSLASNPQIKGIFEPFCFAFFARYYEFKFMFKDIEEVMTKEPFTSDNIVWKDVPSCVENLDFKKWFADTNFKHALLIRHPKDVLMSQIAVNGDPIRFMDFLDINTGHPKMKEMYSDMVKLRNFLAESGSEWRVFDSTDLGSDNCAEFMKSLCQFAGLPFEPDLMLSMKSSEELPSTWWTAPTSHMIKDNAIMNFDFHGPALKTEGFVDSIKKPALPELTEMQIKNMKTILDETMDNYNLLVSDIKI